MRYLAILLALVWSGSLSAQILDPVSWSTSYEQVGTATYDIKIKASIDEGWTIYSQHLEPGGPVPTEIHFEPDNHFQLEGEVEEGGNLSEKDDPIFGMRVASFSDSAVFTQRVVVKDLSRPIRGSVYYMTCDDERCLPATEEAFTLSFEASEAEGAGATSPPAVYQEPNDPVGWEAQLTQAGERTYELTIKARIGKGWNMYSQDMDPDKVGPIPTALFFETEEGVELLGPTQERSSKREKVYDPNFGMDLLKVKEEAVYQQRFRTADTVQLVRGYLEYMVCNEEKCLPPAALDFRIRPAALSVQIGPEAMDQAAVSDADLFQRVMSKPRLDQPVQQCSSGQAIRSGKNNWQIFVLGFLGGLVALLTPCVFPMIPLTVSFFTKGSDQERSKGLGQAALYGFFILLVYLVLSIPFHLMDSINPDILNDISTNVYLNIAFFLIFLFFAFSFFGYYELTLPDSWSNRASAAEGLGGLVGVFFMALTLALVSFSCTGPILGSLLAGALTSDGGAWQLTSGMGGFGLALALPFGLFAAFPRWMNSLPKSGGWLNEVKVVLGFLELALALKFLSNADLVKHWGLLKIEPFLGLWIVIFAGLGLYLFGIIRFPHDSPVRKWSAPRIALGALSFAFVLYLASGFLYNERAGSYRPLKLLSGLAPPVCYSFFQPCDCPQNLNCFKDLETGLAYAREVDKPVMIDFTGYACVNCRKMEEHVWPESPVYSTLKNDFVLISLYVDDKKELPAEEQIVVEKATGGTRTLRTYGNKWSHFQTEYFQANSQPYYVLLSPEGKLLSNPVGYTPDAGKYANFLECGLNAYRRLTLE